ncbi:MAG TPA: sigma-70 family RNA polymerase sigma factor [Acidimicrobiales bacterium]|jgi:RNA polymerase sigma-B factor|nr:sigma-70 family RNA polymerase sigma factor [Acidimicrobiales bacterium]
MTLLKQWPILSAVLLPYLMAARPPGRLLAWNLGDLDDAVAVALAYLQSRAADSADVVMFHSGMAECRPIEWRWSDLRGIPKEPWLEPVAGHRSSWRPGRELLESVVLGAPPGPVDLLILSDVVSLSAEQLTASLDQVGKGGCLFFADPSLKYALPATGWRAIDSSGRLYRRVAGTAVARPCQPSAEVTSLACHQQRAELISSYTSLARSLARRFSQRGESAEDLEQVAMLALVKAAGRFEPERGRPFGPYAATSITGELKRHFRDKVRSVRVPRSVQEMHLAIRTAREDLAHINGHSPTVAEIAAHLGTTEEKVLTTMETSRNVAMSSLDEPTSSTGQSSANLPFTEPGFERAVNRCLLEQAATELSPTERLILKAVFFENRTQVEVADALHVSQMHVSRIMNRALARMRPAFTTA